MIHIFQISIARIRISQEPRFIWPINVLNFFSSSLPKGRFFWDFLSWLMSSGSRDREYFMWSILIFYSCCCIFNPKYLNEPEYSLPISNFWLKSLYHLAIKEFAYTPVKIIDMNSNQSITFIFKMRVDQTWIIMATSYTKR